MFALESVWATVLACCLINFTTKFGFEHKTYLILYISELNSELPALSLWIASTTFFEFVSKYNMSNPSMLHVFNSFK
jgi:hypothetical protein